MKPMGEQLLLLGRLVPSDSRGVYGPPVPQPPSSSGGPYLHSTLSGLNPDPSPQCSSLVDHSTQCSSLVDPSTRRVRDGAPVGFSENPRQTDAATRLTVAWGSGSGDLPQTPSDILDPETPSPNSCSTLISLTPEGPERKNKVPTVCLTYSVRDVGCGEQEPP
ncbi:unnamed protein product [Gadus morhua 'NCC']